MARFMGNGGCSCSAGDGSTQPAITGGVTTTAADSVSPEGVVTTDVKVSNHPQNLLSVNGDGLMVERGECCDVDGSETKVEAGDGIMLSGNGTQNNPYVVETTNRPGPGCCACEDGGTGGGEFSCEQARECFEAGDGMSYDPSTGVFEARPSGDAGNTLAFGDDGGLFVPASGDTAPAPAPSTVEGGETDTAVNTVEADGDVFTVTPEAKISADEGNTIEARPDGLYAPEPEPVQPNIEAGDNITVEGAGSADDPYVVSSQCCTEDGSNPATVNGGESPTAVNTVEADGSNFTVTPEAKISEAEGNTLTAEDDGLYAPGTVVEAGDGVTVEGDGTQDAPYVVSATGGGDAPSMDCEPADAADAWPYEAEDTNGGAVFCASDGVLRGQPERFFDAMDMEVVSSSGNREITEIMDPEGGKQELVSATGEFVNPSPVLPMKVVVEASVNHNQFTFTDPESTVQTWTDIELGGDVEESTLSVHQRATDHRGGEMIELDFMGSTKTKVVTIPPGGTMTVRIAGLMQVQGYTGEALINELNHRVTIWGGN